MYADYDIQTSEGYPLGVYCICGRSIHLKESEAAEYSNVIKCPKCGYEATLIRPSKRGIKDIDILKGVIL